jgi:prepilin-type N-terminal cleavage/methylation domain-containing protein
MAMGDKEAVGRLRQKGFMLVELVVAIAILGILVGISIPNYRLSKAKADCLVVISTLKYLMDGEDFYRLEKGTFFPESGSLNIPKGKAMEIPELAYHFPDGHKTQFKISVINNKNRNRYIIRASCDFDSDGNGRDDTFTATTDIQRGVVSQDREIFQLS